MKDKLSLWVIGSLSALLYFYMFYQVERYEGTILVVTYALLFAGYLYFILAVDKFSLKVIIGLAILFRLISLFSIPALSDDFYRFIWDGMLWSNGINPFAFRPAEVMARELLPVSEFVDNLYVNLNATTTYTVYPTIPQAINWVAYRIAGSNLLMNVIIQRSFIIAADLLAIYFLMRIIRNLKLRVSSIVLYALNPLVILELAGNLHHEALMIAFFLGFIFYDSQGKTIKAGLMLALAIAAKLLPLMFLPFIFLRSKAKLHLVISISIGLLLLFSPLLDQSFLHGMQSSLTLYYQKFEFNAGLYFLAREVGYWIYGYNAIELIGKLFFSLSMLSILVLSFFGYRQNVQKITSYTLIYLVYTLFSLILHPWYILFLVALAPISKFRFSLVWSFLIFLTYLGYSASGFDENYWIIAVEYIGLFLALVADQRHQALANETLKAAP